MNNKEISKGILSILRKQPAGLLIFEITKNRKFKSTTRKCVIDALEKLISENKVIVKKNKYYISEKQGDTAVILRVKETFGIALLSNTNEEIFIRGSYLKGSLPGETVNVVKVFSSTHDDSYEVKHIEKTIKKYEFVGTVNVIEGKYFVKADKLLLFPIAIKQNPLFPVQDKDKVSAVIIKRGNRHSDLVAEIVTNYGSGNIAAVCAMASLDANGVSDEFILEVLDQAKRLEHRGIRPKDLYGRVDLRGENIFTIDSIDSMDLDDAVSLEKIGDEYVLGVHIADVSHYVKEGTELDLEAFNRGTSIYYANKVIPMLPKELSNGICSLSQGVDRLAFSAFITLDNDGKILDYEFKKSIINSRVKGIYSEINTILDNTATEEIRNKYQGQIDMLNLMNELADKLMKNKNNRGAPQIDKPESKFIIDENDVCVDVVARSRGKSECIIEELMLTANQAAAMASKLLEIPFVYRIHEPITLSKAEDLKSALKSLGLDTSKIPEKIKPSVLSGILNENRDKENKIAINNIVLRSMSKARYSQNPVGHFGLVLEDYAHFTSPIRRYPDLAIHRILSEYIKTQDSGYVKKMFKNKVVEISEKSSEAELSALSVERMCEDCYKAEYMSKFVGESFKGVIISIKNYGFYVALNNTIEGLVRIDGLPIGDYDLVNDFILKDFLSGKEFKVGDFINVVCTKVDIAAGLVDFAIDSNAV